MAETYQASHKYCTYVFIYSKFDFCFHTPEGKGEGGQSHPITPPSKNLVTPAAVSRPWGKSSEQPQAIVKPFHREKSEEFDTWQDEHSKRKQDQRPKSHKGNNHFQRDKGQISKPTHCTFEVHFDKGQTRCYWNNPSLIIKVTNLQSEYLQVYTVKITYCLIEKYI